ncbi:helicase ARIP4-like, partial [Saccoglossus kowalevskii]
MVESLQRFKSSSGFGCILAHSMGLGKTLQVISFIDVIFRNTTAKSILCIVPINTIQNWMAEFDMWLPMKKNTDPSTSSQEECQNTEEIYHRTFNVFLLNDSYKTTVGRAKVIADWHDKGGVLLMGYEMYRLLTLRKFTLSRRKKKNKAGSKEIVIDLEEEDKKNEMAA